ncbi:MAG TPA: chemotaxis protein CheW [Gemmatimonadaceae bacterium]|nr:chemotaxis protein CheW [Gemmatimonadaceae bacterium]
MSENTSHQVVTFRVGDDEFAADIMAVERVLRYAQPTVVPNLPEWVEGVIEYEGRVIPIIDLARRFEIERTGGAAGATDGGATTRRVLVFAVGDEWIGAVVDSVLEVVVIPQERLSPPPAIFRGLSAEYLRGLVRSAGTKRGATGSASTGSLLIFLEVERLLSATERLHLERAMADGGIARGADDESSARGKRDA